MWAWERNLLLHWTLKEGKNITFTKEKVSFPGQMKDILDMEGFRHLTHTLSNLFLKIL
jgi:hypothetical protein